MKTLFFFFNDTATTEIYTLSLHDALPISSRYQLDCAPNGLSAPLKPASTSSVKNPAHGAWRNCGRSSRSEEHTSELQSRPHLVCRLLLEKKKKRPSSLWPPLHTAPLSAAP